jgi:hypothetical protein
MNLRGKNFYSTVKTLLEFTYKDQKEPSLQEIKSFKLNDREKQIVESFANFASSNKKYSYRQDMIDALVSSGGFKLIEKEMGKFLDEIYYDKGQKGVDRFVGREFLQPYMSRSLFVNLFIKNPEIDAKDITGLISTHENPPNPILPNILKALRRGSNYVNVSFYYYIYYDHKHETNYKILEALLKYAILHELKDTGYMREREMSERSKEHFKGVFT